MLADAYETLKQGSEIDLVPLLRQAATGSGGRKTKKNYLNKELIYDDETAFLSAGRYKIQDLLSGEYLIRKVENHMLNRWAQLTTREH